jgi:hypothetical protein
VTTKLWLGSVFAMPVYWMRAHRNLLGLAQGICNKDMCNYAHNENDQVVWSGAFQTMFRCNTKACFYETVCSAMACVIARHERLVGAFKALIGGVRGRLRHPVTHIARPSCRGRTLTKLHDVDLCRAVSVGQGAARSRTPPRSS